MKRNYELRSDQGVLATLRWESAFGSRADAATANARWTLKRVGFFSPRATIRAAGSEKDLAVYLPNWFGNGAIELASGPRWKWKQTDFFRSRFGFVDMENRMLIEYHTSLLDIPVSAKLVVSPQAMALPELPLLVVMGWYVAILSFDDMGMSGGSIAAAGA